MNAKSGLFLAFLSIGLFANSPEAKANDEATSEGEEKGGSEAASTEASAKAVSEADVGAEPEMTTGFEKGRGFFASDGGVNRMAISGRLQLRAQYQNIDEGGDERGHQHAFELRRARLYIGGAALTERLTYQIQAQFDRGSVGLLDYYIDYRVGDGDVRVRMGQYRVPFTRQFIQSTKILEFADRNIINEYIGNRRDIGFQIHNNLDSNPETEWVVGVFNGTGDQSTLESTVVVDPMTGEGTAVGERFSNVPEKIRPAVVMRIGHNSEGAAGVPYTEADITRNEKFRYSVAAAALTHFHYGAGQASTRAGIDFAVKQDGMSASGGVYADLQGPKISDLSYVGIAAYAQAGYMLTADKQLAVLYASITQDGGDNQQELSAAFTHFEFGHDLSLVTDVAYLHTDDGAKRQDVRLRSQVQVAF